MKDGDILAQTIMSKIWCREKQMISKIESSEYKCKLTGNHCDFNLTRLCDNQEWNENWKLN